jgi:hypothetical protein
MGLGAGGYAGHRQLPDLDFTNDGHVSGLTIICKISGKPQWI